MNIKHWCIMLSIRVNSPSKCLFGVCSKSLDQTFWCRRGGARAFCHKTPGGSKVNSSLCTLGAIFNYQQLMCVSRSALYSSLPLRLCWESDVSDVGVKQSEMYISRLGSGSDWCWRTDDVCVRTSAARGGVCGVGSGMNRARCCQLCVSQPSNIERLW